MIVKLLSFKPNKDSSVTLYLDKGADLHSLIDMIGENIFIDQADAQAISESISDTMQIMFNRLHSTMYEVYNLGKQEEQARHDMPAPEGE